MNLANAFAYFLPRSVRWASIISRNIGNEDTSAQLMKHVIRTLTYVVRMVSDGIYRVELSIFDGRRD